MNNIAKIKIGLDFHGVISNDPDFFSGLSKLAIDKGHEIHIISGGINKEEQEILRKHKVKHTQIFSMVHYFDGLGEVTYFNDGTFQVDDELWNKVKAEYCQEYGIDIMIDDSPRYGKHFQTPYCRYDAQDLSGTVNGHFLELSSPERSLNDIEEYVSAHKLYEQHQPKDNTVERIMKLRGINR